MALYYTAKIARLMSICNWNNRGGSTIENEAKQKTPLYLTTSEDNLGIEISKDLKPNNQVCKAWYTAEIRSFGRDYTTYVRPHLEYAIATWIP